MLEQQKNMMLHLAGITMIGMPLIAIIIDYFSDSLNLRERVFVGEEWYIQVGVGVAVGIASALLAWGISSMKFLEKSSSKYSDLIKRMNLNKSEIVFISVCAGFGEEILFRGALQFFWGIVITAIVFIAVHGYLNPRDWRISVYGIFMTLVICVFGWITEVYGIWSAIIAHAIVDLILLWNLDTEEEMEKEESQ